MFLLPLRKKTIIMLTLASCKPWLVEQGIHKVTRGIASVVYI